MVRQLWTWTTRYPGTLRWAPGRLEDKPHNLNMWSIANSLQAMRKKRWQAEEGLSELLDSQLTWSHKFRNSCCWSKFSVLSERTDRPRSTRSKDCVLAKKKLLKAIQILKTDLGTNLQHLWMFVKVKVLLLNKKWHQCLREIS